MNVDYHDYRDRGVVEREGAVIWVFSCGLKMNQNLLSIMNFSIENVICMRYNVLDER